MLSYVTTKNPKDHERQDAARAYVARLVADQFGGNQKAASAAMKIAPSTLNEFLSTGRGGGKKFLNAIADYTGDSLDAITGREPPRVEYEPGMRRDIPAVALGNHKDWPGARAAVERDFGDVYKPEQYAEGERVTMSHMPEVVTPEFVRRILDAIIQAKADAKRWKAEQDAKKAAAEAEGGKPASAAPPPKSTSPETGARKKS